MRKEKIIKAESFDVMQYLYGRVHDPLMHCMIRFSGHIDAVILKKAVTLSGETIPLIRCCFDVTARRPCWKEQCFTGEDIVNVIKEEPNDKEQSERLLASTIDIIHEPQLKIFLIKAEQFDTLCVIINHMVCDGAGFKEYLYLLSDIYTKLEGNVNDISNPECYSRGTGQLFSGFTLTEKLNILFSKYDLPKQKQQMEICLEGDSNVPFFVTRCIAKEQFLHLKAYAKSEGATVNDMVLAAYVRLLSRKIGSDRIVIPCPVDLRKYLCIGRKHGICNLTSNFICDVTVCEHDTFHETLSQVSCQMKRQKMSRKCLKPVVMLELAFHILPFRTIKRIFGKIFTIPVISFTNLGVIDKELLKFGNAYVLNAYLTGAIKYVPYFQIAISTYDDSCTLSSNLHGTPQDKIWTECFLEELSKELMVS
jgi:NRPS condensation-like uncharacterized protein